MGRKKREWNAKNVGSRGLEKKEYINAWDVRGNKHFVENEKNIE